MIAPSSLSVSDLWHIAGWTMVHFLWLGALLGAAAAVCRLFLRRTSANVRYTFMLAWLIALAALPIGIAAWMLAHSPPLNGGAGEGIASIAPSLSPGRLRLSDESPTALLPIASPSTSPTIELHQPEIDAASLAAPAPAPALNPSLTRTPNLLTAVESCIPYLPWLWLIGTPLTFALLLTGLIGTRRLDRASRPISDGPIAELLAQLTASLRIGKRVTVAVCDRIAAPVLIGIVRPIILLPPAALTGWSPDEIEMVLLHELAHVRRWDNLVNLLQRIVESLLFFHPAVWLISTWVRHERESCCDAVVVTRTNRPHAYAEMLVTLAAQLSERSEPGRPRPRFSLTLRGRGRPGSLPASSAMAAGPLRSRIRRILQLEDDPMLVSGKSFVLMFAALVVAATFAVLYLPTIGQAEQPATEATENTEKNLDVAAQEETQKNLKRLIMAVHNNDANRGSLPANAIYDANGKPLLSWRVHLLPFLAEEKLYREFHLDEPWDSDHNLKLVARMPDVFKNPKLGKPGMTSYVAVIGKECVFNGSPKGLRFQSISDGTSKTIAIVEANADLAVEWTKPQDWNFDRGQPTKGLGQLWPGGWYAAWVDGSVRRVDNREPADKVGIQFTRAGREQASLKESANRLPADIEGPGPPGGPAGARPGPTSKFPSLEDQKLADLAWKRLGLELEPIADADLKRVKALGYDGGVKVAAPYTFGEMIKAGDILVGLHVWPMGSVKDVVESLSRDDLAELIPLKFYVVRPVGGGFGGPAPDTVVTGRISVQTSGDLGGGGGRSTSNIPMGMGSQPKPRSNAAAGDPYESTDIKPPLGRELGAERRPLVAESATPDATNTAPADNPFAATTDPVAADTGAQPDKSTLRYDGKLFESWRNTWKTELSTEKRGEAVKALAAFGRAGYGKEAAETILDVAGEYDFKANTNDSDDPLRTVLYDSLITKVPAKDWLPLLRARYEKNPEKWKWFAFSVLAPRRAGNELDDNENCDFLLQLARLPDDDFSNRVVNSLVVLYPDRPETTTLLKEKLKDKDHWLGAVRWYINTAQFPPEVVDLLLHGDEKQQSDIRDVLLGGGPIRARTALLETLLQILNEETKSADHLAAIRGIAAASALGSIHYAGRDQSLEAIVEKGPLNLRIAAAVALEQVTRGHRQAIPLLVEKLGDLSKHNISPNDLVNLVQKEKTILVKKNQP